MGLVGTKSSARKIKAGENRGLPQAGPILVNSKDRSPRSELGEAAILFFSDNAPKAEEEAPHSGFFQSLARLL